MGPPRVPTARQVFPILARFQNLRPRRFNATPVGFEPPRGAVDADQLFNGLRHLYHDLGVLVFAGCSRRRVARIAAILRRVVQGGGPLSLSLRLGEDRDSARTHFERTEVLRETECFVGAADGLLPAGNVDIHGLLRIATDSFSRIIKEDIVDHLAEDHARICFTTMETQVDNLPRSAMLQTVDGPRALPVVLTTILKLAPDSRGTSTHTWVSTVGQDRVIGRVHLKHRMEVLGAHQASETAVDTDAAGRWPRYESATWLRDTIEPLQTPSYEVTRLQTLADVRDNILAPLWQLERDVWQPKAEALMEAKTSRMIQLKREWREARDRASWSQISGAQNNEEQDKEIQVAARAQPEMSIPPATEEREGIQEPAADDALESEKALGEWARKFREDEIRKMRRQP